MKKNIFTIILSCMILFSCGGNSTPSISGNISYESVSIDSSLDLSIYDKVYHNYNSYDNLEIYLESIPEIYTLTINDELIKSDDYKISDERNLIIRNSVVRKLQYGNYLLSINNKINFNLVVYDDRTPTIISENTFKYVGYKHPTFKFELFGGKITSLIYKDNNYKEYISIIGNEVKINATFCESVLDGGANSVTIRITQDNPITEYKITDINVIINTPQLGDIIVPPPPISEDVITSMGSVSIENSEISTEAQ